MSRILGRFQPAPITARSIPVTSGWQWVTFTPIVPPDAEPGVYLYQPGWWEITFETPQECQPRLTATIDGTIDHVMQAGTATYRARFTDSGRIQMRATVLPESIGKEFWVTCRKM